ncbi:CDK5RAP3-like protein [Sitodiplosis mosellana]|uniref:CDK5RAP3-like protein n=1 Tax=Sitodiplosis mosellana TaxID=263140 RepID=UPI0024439F1F|nr:CDK5RAP3-like protein [Sitodiplosis mosellana]
MNEQNIPIDIHIGKLLEWLVSRHIVAKNWHTRIPEIRNKIGHAINDMPSHEQLVKLLSGTHIHYFHCLQIIEILKTTEADTKSVFGRYGSQRMKDWLEIARLYERDSIYLGEAAQILVRNVNFELPSVKKQITKFDQLIDEALKKIQDQTATETVLNAQRAALCQKLGIKGENLRDEFVEKLKDLPKFYEEIAVLARELSQATQIYGKGSKNEECLPVLRHIIEKGNTTAYEYIHHEAPLSIEEPPVEIKLTIDVSGGAGNTANEIDFGEGDGGEIDFVNDIDFGGIESGSEVTLQTGDIDWGLDEPNAEEIDFDISLKDSGITIESSGMAGGVARNNEALTVLDSPIYREQFLDELFELEAFLKMRQFELSSLENSNTATFLFLEGMDDHTVKSISPIILDVQAVLERATDELLQHLYQLKHSEKYADVLAEKLQQKVTAVKKIEATRNILKEKIEQFKNEKTSIQPLVGKLTEQTKILQNKIAEDISKRYKNRPVNLMGGLNFF